MPTQEGRTDRYHHDPVTGEHPNTAVKGEKHDIDRDRGAAERVSLETGDAGVQVAHGVTSALKDLGHAGEDAGLAIAHGVTGSLTDMGHAVENIGRAFESEESRARHDAHHNARIDEKYDAKIAHDEYVDERKTEREEHKIEHKEARREHHIEHMKAKGEEPYKVADEQSKYDRKNAGLEEKDHYKADKKHLKEAHKEAKAEARKERKER